MEGFECIGAGRIYIAKSAGVQITYQVVYTVTYYT
jgi:hypothetical protein